MAGVWHCCARTTSKYSTRCTPVLRVRSIVLHAFSCIIILWTDLIQAWHVVTGRQHCCPGCWLRSCFWPRCFQVLTYMPELPQLMPDRAWFRIVRCIMRMVLGKVRLRVAFAVFCASPAVSRRRRSRVLLSFMCGARKQPSSVSQPGYLHHTVHDGLQTCRQGLLRQPPDRQTRFSYLIGPPLAGHAGFWGLQ